MSQVLTSLLKHKKKVNQKDTANDDYKLFISIIQRLSKEFYALSQRYEGSLVRIQTIEKELFNFENKPFDPNPKFLDDINSYLTAIEDHSH